MARALECPACGHRHRLDSVPSGDTFRCDNCGQILKAPSTVASEPGAPPPPARSSRPTSTGAPAPVAPPPRRAATVPAATTDAGVAPAPRRAPARNAAAVSATVAAVDGNGTDAAADSRRSAPSGRPGGVAPAPAPGPAPARKRVHWYWRLLAWIAAVPLAFVVTAWPAYKFGFITKDDLLDIFVGNGIGRYVRLGIVTVVWALVTALLVQLFVEGGRARAARRRRSRAVAT
jgi:hypothetical protein